MIFARLKGGRARGDATASALGMLAGTGRALPSVRSGLAGDATVLPRAVCGGCDVGACARRDGAPLGADHVAAEPGEAEGCEGAAAALGILPAWFGEVRGAYTEGGWAWEAQQPMTLQRCLGATEGVFGTKGVAALQCELFDLFAASS